MCWSSACLVETSGVIWLCVGGWVTFPKRSRFFSGKISREKKLSSFFTLKIKSRGTKFTGPDRAEIYFRAEIFALSEELESSATASAMPSFAN